MPAGAADRERRPWADSLRVYLQAYSASLQAKLEYRADFVVGVVTSMMLQAAGLSLLWMVLRAVPTLGGWTAPQVLYLFGMTAACLGGSELFFNQIWILPSAIVMGDLDRLLTYPVRALPFFLLTRPELHAFGNVLTGLAYVVASLCWLKAAWYVWLAAPLFWLCGMLTYTSVLVWFASLSFRFVGPQLSSMMIGHNLLQATRYPLGAYPRVVRTLLLVLFPFGTFHYVPGSFFFGRGAPIYALVGAPVAAVVTMVLAQAAWNLGLRSYESTGS
jgi:ABC-2 type transport system permease protein